MKRFGSILFCPLGDRDNVAALESVVALANRNHASITLFGVGPEAPRAPGIFRNRTTVEELSAAHLEAERQRLARFAAQCDADFADIVVESGNTALTLVLRVLTVGHDLVVVTTDGDRSDTATINRLLRKCPCPVWVIRPTRAPEVRVLATVGPDPDEGELNRSILELASSIVGLYGGELHVAHAWELSDGHPMRSPICGGYSEADIDELRREQRTERYRALARLLAPTQAEGADWKIHLVNGPAAESIVGLADRHRINMLVLGTVARTGLSGLLIGNTAERVVNEVKCSLLAVKPPGFVSPLATRERRGVT